MPERFSPNVPQITTYRQVSERLLTALAHHNAARAAYDAARDSFEDRRRNLLLDGVPGIPDRCSADVREAALARALEPQTCVLRASRERMRGAEAELEAARVQERTEREALRALQLARAE